MLKQLLIFSLLLPLTGILRAQDGGNAPDNQIKGKHKKQSHLNIDNAAFGLLSYDATIGIGGAYLRDGSQGIPEDKRTTFVPLKVSFHFPINIVGARRYRKMADKGLVAGIDFPFSIGTGYVHYNPANASGFKMDVSYELKPGLFGVYRLNKDLDLGAKLSLGIEANNAYLHDPGDRGWFATAHLRAKRWYVDYERFLHRSTQLNFISVDEPLVFYTYPAINEVTIKYALSKKSYLKASIIFASGTHKDIYNTYAQTISGKLPYHLFLMSFGYGQFH